jgi:large subunit ribosomal protein L4
MVAKILTKEALSAHGVELVENGRYTQALHDAVVAYRAARRSGSANSKTKAEVALSGAKPWRQKGTGRARAGYKSSPVWVGGGVVFGPKPRSYRKSLSKGVKGGAFLKALSLRVLQGSVYEVEAFSVGEAKTKLALGLLKSLGLSGSVLVVSDSFSDATYLAARNLENVQLMRGSDVNAESLLRFKTIVLTNGGRSEIVKRLIG